MTPTVRQWKLIEILKESTAKDGITLVDLVDRLAVDARTVCRDLDTLKKQGIPIQKKRKAHGLILCWINENRFTPAAFNVGEAAALYLDYRMLVHLADSFLGQDAEKGVDKNEIPQVKPDASIVNRSKRLFRK